MERSVAFLAPVLAIIALAVVVLAGILPPLPSVDGLPVSFAWITYANTALAGSTTLYVAYFWFRSESVGRSATLLAALGALGVVASLALSAWPGASVGRPGSAFGLYEGTAVLSSGVVLAYLAMERIYRNRDTALLVMPAVMLGVLCEIWLIGRGVATPSQVAPELSVYWESGHRFAVGLGYAAFAVAAVLSAMVLAQRAAQDAETRARQAAAILSAAAVGMPLLLLGICMGAIWLLIDARSVSTSAVLRTASTLLVWLVMLLGMVQLYRFSARRLAWWLLGGFAAATVSLLSSGWMGEALVRATPAA